VERIVALLRNGASRDAVIQAVAEQETVVTKFVSLLLKEESSEANARKKKSKPEIIVDTGGCKPV
jgi:hypothetical protein